MRLPGAVLAGWLAAVGTARAEFPVQDMNSRGLGLEYALSLRGQNITEAEVPSHETIHRVHLGYAPLPFVALQVGLGWERFTVDPHNEVRFNGDYGFSPSYGISAFSPSLAERVRIAVGANSAYFASEDPSGFRYFGFVNRAFLGAILSPSDYLDVAAGLRLHLLDGKMESPSGKRTAFANANPGRGYLTLTLKSPLERAFLTLDAEVSPQVSSDWSRGPREATLGVAVGAVIGWKPSPATSDEGPTGFPAYPEMKEKQRKMAEEL